MVRNTIRWLLVVSLTFAGHWPGHGQPAPASKQTVVARKVSADDIQQLILQLGHDKYRMREKASQELIALGRSALPALEEATSSLDAEIRMRAYRILEAIYLSLPYLMEGLVSSDAKVRREAAQGLERLGPGAREALPALIEALKDPDEGVREAAVSAILTIDPDNRAAAEVVPTRAHVNGKYARLLRRLKAPEDQRTYSEYREFGFYQSCSWAGQTNIPAGYWVYVAPYWYVWEQRLRDQ